jgi:hypothetical protein
LKIVRQHVGVSTKTTGSHQKRFGNGNQFIGWSHRIIFCLCDWFQEHGIVQNLILDDIDSSALKEGS